MNINKPPIFSIICATYNRAHILSRCIESVTEQEFRDWELIIVDDGSSDGTDELIRKYNNIEQIRYFTLEENKGVGFARNYALDKAKGKWIILLDSDNALEKDALRGIQKSIRSYQSTRIHKFCVRSFSSAPMGQFPSSSIAITGVQYLRGTFRGEFHTVTDSDLLREYRFYEKFSGGEGIIWSRIALKTNMVVFHPLVTERYQTDGEDRLSVRNKNYKRLEYVFREDLACLWQSYLRYTPLSLLTKTFKWAAYKCASITFRS